MNIKKKPHFLRKDSGKKIRITRTKKWRRQKGGDSKMRLKMKSYRKMPSIGYGADKKMHGLITLNKRSLEPILIYNLNQLDGIKEHQIVIIAHTSKKNKIEIAKKAIEKKIEIYNLNVKKFLKKTELEKKVKKNIEKKPEHKVSEKKMGEKMEKSEEKRQDKKTKDPENKLSQKVD